VVPASSTEPNDDADEFIRHMHRRDAELRKQAEAKAKLRAERLARPCDPKLWLEPPPKPQSKYPLYQGTDEAPRTAATNENPED